MNLPTEPTPANPHKVRKLVIFSNPKVGKTSSCRRLENALIIDLEDKAEMFEGTNSYVINVKEIAREEEKEAWQVVLEIARELKNSEKTYDYIVIDTITELQSIANTAAIAKYKTTAKGAEFKSSDITEMKWGQGYGKLKRTFFKLAYSLTKHARKAEVFLGHSTRSSDNYNGEVIETRDLDLSKQIRQKLSRDADAIGFMYPEPAPNEEGYLETVVTFKRTVMDSITGANPHYLSDHDIVLTEGTEEEGIVQDHWDKVFLNDKN